jgi:hypothetical protein
LGAVGRRDIKKIAEKTDPNYAFGYIDEPINIPITE